ncbi:13253_t:CDS:2 [Acaulospora morrowiae]|uniref:13253_t:CDS:1 n=1 Tax=Acaulospora morrowiae TaxID=94023 RepID=A0A9N9CVJ7_9GLOM|nr:13253_t:CDS:2 [Acaulospora morrowiae]
MVAIDHQIDPKITSTFAITPILLTLQDHVPPVTSTLTIPSNTPINETAFNKQALLAFIMSLFFGLLFLTATQTDPSPEFPALPLSNFEELLPKEPTPQIPKKYKIIINESQAEPRLPGSKGNLIDETTKNQNIIED